MNTASLLPTQSEFVELHDPLLIATLELERYAKLLDLEDWIVERLRHCEQETFVNFLQTAEDGRAHPVTGVYVRHCGAAGPAAVPVRVSRDAYRNSACAEAMRTSWLCALLGVRYGGAAAAVILDPQKQSERELQGVLRHFGTSAKDVLVNAGLMFPAGLHAVEMDWLEADLPEERHVVLTGKTSSPSTLTRTQEVARGWSELIRCAAGNFKQRVAVQGFGDEMRELVVQLHQRGARVVAVADESGGLRHELGLAPNELIDYVRRHRVLLGYPDAEAVMNADVLETDCDVLILAGGDQQIQAQNAGRIRAGIVVEITPGAITETAAREMRKKLIVPDLVCLGPALLLAVAEANAIGSENRRSAWIRRTLRDTWKSMVEAAERWNCGIAEAARALAIQRVAAILRAKGPGN